MRDSASVESGPSEVASPFVKWAGGKSRLTSLIEERLAVGAGHHRYIEPFVGAGAVFFRMRRRFPRLEHRISDRNVDLVAAYRVVRDDVESLLEHLDLHAAAHTEEYFYRVRACLPDDQSARAARFIYLNRTCYNGLYRVNRKGHFNVPIGRYKRPTIVQRQRLVSVSAALAGIEILDSDFEAAVADADETDLVYFDPPYDPRSQTSDFTSYTAGRFGQESQRRLARVFSTLAERGTRVVLSNSDTPFIRRLYEDLRPQPRLERLTMSRAINSKASGRGPVGELLIYYPRDD